MSRLPFDLADASSDHAWQQLKAFLGDRIEDGLSGNVSAKSIGKIVEEELKSGTRTSCAPRLKHR
jgi:hypothetical protein